ncbi:MFS transporter [Thermanaerothrix sp.]|jgi:MFS family permease|uniref:MFS transporter n=1 Tax=Thermanaerothrix sp. TaxID=2972675 RepID=UPI002ADD98C4|nr:MFS transporter [Thermanaerothrix sp.]
MPAFTSRLSTLLRLYADRLAAFSLNARLYLLSVVISGAAMGVFRLLFNFYVLALGYDEALLGTLIALSSLSALLSALPMGYLVDRLGHKPALLLGSGLSGLAVVAMVLFPSVGVFVSMNLLLGLAQSLSGVTMGPFLMENSGEKERTYLFSFTSGLQTVSGFIGNWVGGYLPTWLGVWRGVAPTSATAYALALGAIVAAAALGLLPLLFLRPLHLARAERSLFAPLSYLGREFNTIGKLILPTFLTSIGAGLIMPFMNVFYRQVHHQPDPVIGTLFAWGSLAMGLGLLIAPPLADRWGKVPLVVVTQLLSIPFLALMGFAPWFPLSAAAYYIRLTLMNMGLPVYQAFVMERVEPGARGTVASLVSMANNFGWAFSPTVSGWIQVHYGFAPAFLGTLVLYTLAVFCYWYYFWRPQPQPTALPAGGATFQRPAHLNK